MIDSATAQHDVFNTPAIYFSLSHGIDEELFNSVVRTLGDAAGAAASSEDIRRHWEAFRERLAGGSPWHSVMPMPLVSIGDPARIELLQAADQSFRNVIKVRPYVVFALDGLRFTVDVFNPANELELPGWPVESSILSLLFSPTSGRGRSIVRDLASSEAFYELVLRLDSVLNPRHVCGIHGLSALVSALRDGRMRSARSLWTLFYPLTVVSCKRAMPSITALSAFCSVVRSWPNDRILLQVKPGFDRALDEAYVRVANLIGLQSWTKYVEGRDSDDSEAGESSATPRSEWPTPVRDNGTAPSSIELVASDSAPSVRQALYQMHAAKGLEERGHKVSAFQAPFISNRVRLTIPLVLVRRPGPDACGYTQCEPWTADRIEELRAWIRDLRKESDSDVIVVSHESSDAVASLPEVAEFILLPYDGLPEPKS